MTSSSVTVINTMQNRKNAFLDFVDSYFADHVIFLFRAFQSSLKSGKNFMVIRKAVSEISGWWFSNPPHLQDVIELSKREDTINRQYQNLAPVQGELYPKLTSKSTVQC